MAAVLTSIFGGWRLYGTWRGDLIEEAEKKARNTQALEDNTEAAKKNSAAIAELTVKFARWERFMERTEVRLDSLERRAEHWPRRGDQQGGSRGGT